MKPLRLLTTGMALVLTAFAAAPQAQANTELRFSLPFPDNHILVTQVMRPFADEVAAATDGQVRVTLYTSAVLGPGAEHLRMTETGIADMALIVPSQTRGRFPMMETGLLPFAFDSAQHGTRVLNALVADHIGAEFDSVQLLFPAMTSPTALLTVSRPLARLEDLNGISLRGTGGAQTVVLGGLGANMVSMAVGDLYVAMERGTIEGTILSLAAAPGYKLEELVRYVNRVNFSATPIAVVMNQRAWSRLTPAQQEAVMAAAANAALNTGRAYDEADGEGLEVLIGNGAEVVDFPPEEMARLREISAPEWDSWTAELRTQGVDAEAFMAAFTAAVEALR